MTEASTQEGHVNERNRGDSNAIYLALDFDGVLHHAAARCQRADDFRGMSGEQIKATVQSHFVADARATWFVPSGRLFDRECHLREVLAACPRARLIVSSAWRHRLTDSQLLDVLSPEVASRVVGVLDRTRDKYAGQRGDKVEVWMRAHGLEHAFWLAIDDEPFHYIDHFNRLVQTHWRGLDGAGAARLIDRLTRITADADRKRRPVPITA